MSRFATWRGKMGGDARARASLIVLLGLMLVQTGPALAQGASSQQQGQSPDGQTPPADQAEEDQPIPAPLAVGSMAIASDAALSIDAMSVDVTTDRVTYTYKLKNNGPTKLSLAASVTEPDLELNNDGKTVYLLPTDTAENVVGLEVHSGGKPVVTTSQVQTIALGVDRRADLAGAGIPLIPFGEATEKALSNAKPETIAKLANLGLVTPPNPSRPNDPVAGDWSLHVVHSWTQNLDPTASSTVDLAFQPIKAVYTIDASGVAGFDALKDQTCLTPQLMNSVRALLATKGSTVDVTDILVSNDGPARWLQNPTPTMSVHKRTPNSVVSFCGVDQKTQGATTVTGIMQNSNEMSGLRVLIFARSEGK